jgi:hypothetical protein
MDNEHASKTRQASIVRPKTIKAGLTQQGGCPIELAQKIGRQGENRRSIFRC